MTRVGAFELLERLAVGGMAEVWLAAPESEPDRRVVVKRLLPHLLHNRDFVKMFADEGNLGLRLSHPGVVRVEQLGWEGERPYLVMEYVAGRDLRSVLRRHVRVHRTGLPPRMALEFGTQVCDALRCVHALQGDDGRPLGVVHRDVTPQNLITTTSGQVKVLDFGIAKSDDQTTETRAGILKGNYPYMSPESIRGHVVDSRSDLFSLAVVLWELLTGRRLYKRETDFLTLQAVCYADPAPPSRYAGEQIAGLDALFERALSRNPDARFQTAQELEQALREGASSLPGPQPEGTAWIARYIDELFVGAEDAVAEETEGSSSESETQRGVSRLRLQRGQARLSSVRLPLPPTSFVGREGEVRKVTELLENGHRMVSVVGPGGIGKSRLVIEVATRLEANGADVVYGDLATVEGEGHLYSQLSRAVGQVPAARDERQLVAALLDRERFVIVLDGAEGLGEPAFAALSRLVAAVPTMRVLVASRRLLKVRGETAFELSSMPEAEAQALFQDRVEAVRLANEPIDTSGDTARAIVRRLEGWPLSIELAAARMATLGTREIARQLGAKPKAMLPQSGESGFSLHETIDWSWGLMSSTAKSAFLQCSVFSGGFDFAAAQSIVRVAQLTGAAELQALLDSLVDQSMLRRVARTDDDDGGRYQMYESIREYAWQRLIDAERDRLESRHDAYYLRTFSLWERRLDTVQGTAAQRKIARNVSNIEAVRDRALRPARGHRTDAEMAVTAALILDGVWSSRGPLHKCLSNLDAALAHPAIPNIDPELTARALAQRALGHREAGDLDQSQADLVHALDLLPAGDFPQFEAEIKRRLGLLETDRNRYSTARPLFESALDQFTLLGASDLEGKARFSLGTVDLHLGELEAARAQFESARAVLREAGDLGLAATVLDYQALALAHAFDLDAAQQAAARALEEHRELCNVAYEGYSLVVLALVRQELGRLEEARELCELAIRRTEGEHIRFAAHATGYLGAVLHELGQRHEARSLYESACNALAGLADDRYEGLFRAYLSMLHAADDRIDSSQAQLNRARELLAHPDQRHAAPVLELAEQQATLERARSAAEAGDFGKATACFEQIESVLDDLPALFPDLHVRLARRLIKRSLDDTVRPPASAAG